MVPLIQRTLLLVFDIRLPLDGVLFSILEGWGAQNRFSGYGVPAVPWLSLGSISCDF